MDVLLPSPFSVAQSPTHSYTHIHVPPTQAVPSGSETVSTRAERKEIGDRGDDTAFNDNLLSYLAKLSPIKETVELLPLDLIETKATSWVIQVLEWMRSVPSPGAAPSVDPEDRVTFHSATRKLHDAGPIVCEVSSEVVDALVVLGIMNIDPSLGPIGFNSQVKIKDQDASPYTLHTLHIPHTPCMYSSHHLTAPETLISRIPPIPPFKPYTLYTSYIL